jgi:hypothetical protein
MEILQSMVLYLFVALGGLLAMATMDDWQKSNERDIPMLIGFFVITGSMFAVWYLLN